MAAVQMLPVLFHIHSIAPHRAGARGEVCARACTPREEHDVDAHVNRAAPEKTGGGALHSDRWKNIKSKAAKVKELSVKNMPPLLFLQKSEDSHPARLLLPLASHRKNLLVWEEGGKLFITTRRNRPVTFPNWKYSTRLTCCKHVLITFLCWKRTDPSFVPFNP